MRNLCSCLLILVLSASCADDIDTNVIDGQKAISAETAIAYRSAGEMPANSDNPYENAGNVYDQILTAYYASGVIPTNIAAISERVKTLASTTAGFAALKGSGYHDVQIDKVNYILANPTTCQANVINASGLSATGKVMLGNYITGVICFAQQETEFKPIYEYICDFEASVLASATLNAKDKRVILVVTSISRYTYNKMRKRPKKNTDMDWTILIANLTGGTFGADFDTAEAVTTALFCGIAQN